MCFSKSASCDKSKKTPHNYLCGNLDSDVLLADCKSGACRAAELQIINNRGHIKIGAFVQVCCTSSSNLYATGVSNEICREVAADSPRWAVGGGDFSYFKVYFIFIPARPEQFLSLLGRLPLKIRILGPPQAYSNA